MISGLVRQGHHTLRRWMLDPGVQRGLRWGGHALAGFFLSAASLEQGPLTLTMGLVWACRGWESVLAAAGGCLGYWAFWGQAGLPGVLCTVLSLMGALLLGDLGISRRQPLLIPAIGMLIVSAVGLGFQVWAGDTTSVALHLVRVALGGAAPWLFWTVRQTRDPILEWLSWGLVTLALAQIAPFSWLGLGFVAAGAMAAAGAFPCAAITGLALDLAGITSVPMTAVTVLAYLVRFLPRVNWSLRCLAPGIMGLVMMRFGGQWEFAILPGLFLGGFLGVLPAGPGRLNHHRGQTGAAQVQLEMAAGVLAQTQQLLMEVEETPVDGDALVSRAAEMACAGCSGRSSCRDARRLAQLPGELLEKPLLTAEELPIRCRKAGRVLQQLHRAQEQLRAIRADRARQQEYRAAVVQQYQFLSRYLQDLSDRLSRREETADARYDPVVSVWGNRAQSDNGDRCIQFSGVGGKYYVVLCDGMGTGMGAVQEGKTAVGILKKLLRSGFPAEHALRSVNSLCALRERAGAVTVDLAEIWLDSGRVELYKWGAAASWLVTAAGVRKLGGPSVPPGMSVTDSRETRCHLTLRREQILVLTSDGLSENGILASCRGGAVTAEGIGRQLLSCAREESQDDATVVTVQLMNANNEM